jgi:hypothetical protein
VLGRSWTLGSGIVDYERVYICDLSKALFPIEVVVGVVELSHRGIQ